MPLGSTTPKRFDYAAYARRERWRQAQRFLDSELWHAKLVIEHAKKAAEYRLSYQERRDAATIRVVEALRRERIFFMEVFCQSTNFQIPTDSLILVHERAPAIITSRDQIGHLPRRRVDPPFIFPARQKKAKHASSRKEAVPYTIKEKKRPKQRERRSNAQKRQFSGYVYT